MTPRDIDLGRVTEVAEDAFDTLGRNPFARYALLILLVGGVLGYFFWLLR